MKYKALLILPILFIALCVVSTTFAQNPPGFGGTTGGTGFGGTTGPAKIVPLCNPLKANNITELLVKFVDLAIFLGVIFAVIMFFWIGFKFVMARGNSSELEEARKWFFYAIIGTAILISSKVIVEVVKTTLTSAGVVNSSSFSNPITNVTNNCN